LTALHFGARLRASSFTSDRTRSALFAASGGFEPTPGSHLGVSGGTRVTRDRASGIEERTPWTGVDADLELFHGWYLFGSFERERAAGEDLSQTHGGLSFRF
jgi:hypothetical protein